MPKTGSIGKHLADLNQLFEDSSDPGLRGVKVIHSGNVFYITGTVPSRALKTLARDLVAPFVNTRKLVNRLFVRRLPKLAWLTLEVRSGERRGRRRSSRSVAPRSAVPVTELAGTQTSPGSSPSPVNEAVRLLQRHGFLVRTIGINDPAAGGQTERWVAWDRAGKRIVAQGKTRAEAQAAAAEAGESRPVLENVVGTSKLLAKAQRRGEQRCHEWLTAEGGTLTAEAVGGVLGISPEQVDERREAGKLLAVPVEARAYAYPAWQFLPGQTLPGLEEVLQALRRHDPWARLGFFLTPNLRLDNETPLEALRDGKVEPVRVAAKTYGEHGAA